MSLAQTSTSPPAAGAAPGEILVSVVIPCLNEEDNIECCVRVALEVMDAHGLAGEVIVADNASEDRSAELAAAAGARVVHEPRRGYGSAYLAGFNAALGRYIVMADADLTYDFKEIPRFVEELEQGAELVMGDRMGNIQPGAMPWLHRYVGNPVLTGVLNLFFRTGVSDAHCGMRGLRRDVDDGLLVHRLRAAALVAATADEQQGGAIDRLEGGGGRGVVHGRRDLQRICQRGSAVVSQS